MLAVIVVILAGGAFIATGVAATVRNRALRGGLATFGAAVGGLIVVVLALTLGTVGGVRDSRDDPVKATAPSPAPTPSPATGADEDGVTPRGPSPVDKDELLHLPAGDPSTPPASVPLVAHLEDRDVLRIRAEGFEPHSAIQVRQCRRTVDGFPGCWNHFPVEVGGNGGATFQYQLFDEGNNRCGPDDACAVLVGPNAGDLAFAYTVFGAGAPDPARLRIEPVGPYEEGVRVEVTASDLPAGSSAGIGLCARTCARTRPVRADEDGIARVTVTMRPRCDGQPCVVALIGTGARDAILPVRFAPAPVPEHDARRIGLALSGAGGALLLAWFLARRTDWEPPSEAATPALDAAEL